MIFRGRGLQILITKTIQGVEYSVFVGCNNKANYKTLFVLACDFLSKLKCSDAQLAFRSFINKVNEENVDIDELRYSGCEMSIMGISKDCHLSVPVI